MGKLLIGRYGQPPEAESITISLRDCHQRLGMRPTDFVSIEPPDFFKKAHKAMGKYLVFYVEADEIQAAAMWRPGYYLLPLEAADVLRVFNKHEIALAGESTQRPTHLECKRQPPEDVLERAKRWSDQSQPLLFHCHCPQLVLYVDPPQMLSRHWRVRLTCRKRCQPPLKTKV